jgi:hypothetical protein
MVLIDLTQESCSGFEHFSINRVNWEDRSRQQEWGSQDESMQQAKPTPDLPPPLTPDVSPDFIPD